MDFTLLQNFNSKINSNLTKFYNQNFSVKPIPKKIYEIDSRMQIGAKVVHFLNPRNISQFLAQENRQVMVVANFSKNKDDIDKCWLSQRDIWAVFWAIFQKFLQIFL